MCTPTCLEFGTRVVEPAEIAGKRVLEVGSRDVNGSLRPTYETYGPVEYVGVDMEAGPGVDVLCDAGDLVERFGAESFDVVVSTELLEHVADWRGVVSNLKRVLVPHGILVLTTRSRGFPYHGFPADFWRYEVEDAKVIFGDLELLAVEPDTGMKGVFVKARRPADLEERDLSDVELYSMITMRRERDLPVGRLNSVSVRVRAGLVPVRRRYRILRRALTQRRARPS